MSSPDNIFFDRADVRHDRPVTEAEARQRNRDLAAQLTRQRDYADQANGVAPLGYRARKGIGKAWTAYTVGSYLRMWMGR